MTSRDQNALMATKQTEVIALTFNINFVCLISQMVLWTAQHPECFRIGHKKVSRIQIVALQLNKDVEHAILTGVLI